MKDLIRRIIIETVTDKEIICDKCGWSWDIADGGDDLYICHKCGHDNEPKSQSNLNKLLEKFKTKFPDDLKDKVDMIEKFVVNYIQDHNFTVKFLNSCSTGFNGVRTKDQIIICSPNSMTTLGDFIYTVFHEIRHEEQMDKTGMGLDNPLTDYDLEDFEKSADIMLSAIDELPEEADFYYRSAIFLIKAGQFKEAFHFLESGLILDYDQHIIMFEYFPNLETQKAIFKLIQQYKK
jgi:tetratricopeptide (TPR) repeat protein